MFEQENLQGWNISHIVSSWHRGLGKENAAVAPSLAFKHRVENLPKKNQRWRLGEGWGERKILGGSVSFQSMAMGFRNNKYNLQTMLITVLWLVWCRKCLLRGKNDCGLVNSRQFSLYDLGKALSGPLVQLESGTRVNLNALSTLKNVYNEGLDFHIIWKKFWGYCKDLSE